MKASWYAEALYGALMNMSTARPLVRDTAQVTHRLLESDGDSEKIFAQFRKVLNARGHEKLLPFIRKEFEKIIAREKIKNEVILVTADNKSKSKWGHAYDHYKKEGIISANADLREVVDESIIGGFQIRTKDTIVDGSYKKSLVELYRSITN